MVTENTLKILNQLGFGADINKLESYIMDYKKSEPVSDLNRYKYNFRILEEVLKSIKPSSKALNVEMENIPFDEYDLILKSNPNNRVDTIYGYTDDEQIREQSKLMFTENELMDLVAIGDIEGIDIVCVYNYGLLHGIYAISDKAKCYDFTQQLYGNISTSVDEFDDIDIVEIRARASILRTDDVNNSICEVMHRLRLNSNTETIQIICNDILFNDDTEFNSYWEKLEYLSDMGFETVKYCLLRNIDKDSFKQALCQFGEFISNEENESNRRYRGILVRNNKETEEYKFLIRYSDVDVEENQIFESTVKQVVEKDGILYIEILQVDCNRNVSIDTLRIDDIFELEKKSISRGSRVRFKVIEGKGVMI